MDHRAEPSDSRALTEALRSLGAAVLARQNDGTFRHASTPPDWWGPRFGSAAEFRARSPFLDDFLASVAEDFWQGDADADTTVKSGVWDEGGSFHEAIACRDGVLIVQTADERIGREQAIIQSVHDQRLDRRRLQKELEKKQILLECIMHDLGNPLSAVLMNLQHLDRQLGERSDLQPAVARAIAQADRQRTLIRSIAEVFASDLLGARVRGASPEPVDLEAVAARIVSACAPLAAEKSVTLCPFFSQSRPVVAEPFHLSRVIENLLVNAIRHSPDGGRVYLRFADEGNYSVCRIEDEGPGIDPALATRLFAPFSQGTAPTGQSGLGLYYCRLTVEQWGGRIAGQNRPENGACFEFQLPRAS
jgi:signal transduction histidine kinase